MTFDLAAFSPARQFSLPEAAAVYRDICAGRPWADLPATDPRIDAFVSELIARWPDLAGMTITELEKMDESPWAGPLERSPAHVIANIRWPSAADVLIGFCASAMRCGVYVYNPQSDALYDPGDPADRAHWLAQEHEQNAKLELAVRQGP